MSRVEQAQTRAHDTRREWGRSPSNLSFSAKKARQTSCLSCFFLLAAREFELEAPFCEAKRREGRLRALAVRDEASNKEWQPSQNPSETPFAMGDALTATVIKSLRRSTDLMSVLLFSFHIATKEQYFTIHEVNYFTFGASRIFHLKHYRFYDIINSSINKNLKGLLTWM